MEKNCEKRYVAKYVVLLSVSNFVTTLLPGHPLFRGLKSLRVTNKYRMNSKNDMIDL